MLSHGTTEREAWLWHRRPRHPSTGYLHALFPKLFPSNYSGKSVRGMIQSGSEVSGLSSSNTCFNQSSLVLILGRCVVSVSSESEIFTSSGIGMSSTGCLE
nr:putative ribonuclease H-like domain-containing protein [Tanacetum cinerariifolium]